MLTLSRTVAPLVLLACHGVCQNAPEPPVKPLAAESALRGRVTEFFQFYVEGRFRQAYELVALDRRDSWYGSVKPRLESFEITHVEFSKIDAAQALVLIESKQEIQLPSAVETRLVPITTWWKLENGKWVWYREIRP